MKITICGSITNAKKIHKIKAELEKQGHVVFSHKLMEMYAEGNTEIINNIKEVHHKLKIENSTFKWYYNKIKESDAILVCNFEKKYIPGYVGGSVLMEIGYAHVLDKKIYFLNPIPDVGYKDELMASQPEVINNDLNKLNE